MASDEENNTPQLCYECSMNPVAFYCGTCDRNVCEHCVEQHIQADDDHQASVTPIKEEQPKTGASRTKKAAKKKTRNEEEEKRSIKDASTNKSSKKKPNQSASQPPSVKKKKKTIAKKKMNV